MYAIGEILALLPLRHKATEHSTQVTKIYCITFDTLFAKQFYAHWWIRKSHWWRFKNNRVGYLGIIVLR